jgi:hypothetical protein
VLEPILIPLGFNDGGVVGFWNFRHCKI